MRGERTEDPEVAERWKWKYVDLYRDDTKRRHLGLRRRGHFLGERIEVYLEHRRRHKTRSTARNDRTALEAHLLAALGEKRKVESIDADALQSIVDRLVDDEYRPTSIGTFVAGWASFFVWVGRDADNPVRGLTLPDPGQTDARAWTDDELREIRRAADEIDRRPDRWRENRGQCRLGIELALNTGGRQSELLALEWAAFRESDCTVRFTLQASPHGTTPLKGKVARTSLVLPDWWRFHRRKAKGRVLTWERGGIDVGTMCDQLRVAYQLAGVDGPGLAWHALRHTYSRIFLEMGGRLEELQRSLGHATIRTTERYYAHFEPERAAESARLRIYGHKTRKYG